jgi:hypothetical protein
MEKDKRTPVERAADARKMGSEERLTSAEPDASPQSVPKPERCAPATKSWRKMPPPPERVIVGSAPFRPRPRVGPIRWAAWLELPRVELWEAVALSMRLNPDDDELRKEIGSAGSRFSRLPPEFSERLRLCQKALHFDGPIRPQGGLYRGILQGSACLVLIADVVAYLKTAEFTLPDELQPKPPAEPKANRGDSIKREALISKHVRVWPTIERDLKDASENGLSVAAKTDSHGMWCESAALDWAKQKGKLRDSRQGGPASPFAGLGS